MARQATVPRATRTDGPRPRRLKADARRSSILEAARIAFSKTGDVNGTTMKVIAEHGGISEGVIYRHFESKEQLFYEAVVEPLREAVDQLVAATEVADLQMTAEQKLQSMNWLYRELTSTLQDVLPLLGLVLFGDPKVAKRFFDEHFAVAMNRLATAWRQIQERHGLESEPSDVSARAVMGIALMIALESHHDKAFDRDRAVAIASEGTLSGFFSHTPAPESH